MSQIILPFKLRVSITAECNFRCIYCPHETTKENFTPKKFVNNKVTTDGLCLLLTKINKAYNFQSVSITGGEPFLNSDLDKILKTVYSENKKIELNTNGTLISRKKWMEIFPFVHQVRLSLDSIQNSVFDYLTGTTNYNFLDKVLEFIDIAQESKTDIILNCVVTKKNLNNITQLIDFSRRKKIRLSLLDCYFTQETKEFWKNNFVPMDMIYPLLEKELGEPKKNNEYGCVFHTYFDNEKLPLVRTKSSTNGTMRLSMCNSCSEYCQEGIYALKMSKEGWVTGCPSRDKNKGKLLRPEMSADEIIKTIQPMINSFINANADKQSFSKLKKIHNL